jgi:tetratricopeptide (TPR) repeat protein
VHAVNVADSLGNSPELCEAWAKRAYVHAARTDFASALGAANQAAAIARSLDLAFQTPDLAGRSAAMANLYLGIVETFRGNWQRGSEFAQQAAAEFGACGDMLELANAHALASENLCQHGRLEDALSWAKDGLDIVNRTGANRGILELLVSYAIVLARLGDRAALDTTLERLGTLTSETGGLSKAARDALTARYAMAAGECYLITGRYDDAVRQLESGVKFLDRYSWVGTRPRWVHCYPLLAQAYLHQRGQSGSRKRGASKRTLANLIVKSHRWADAYPSLAPPALLADGMLHWASGDRQAASAKFSEGIEVAEQQGSPLVLADIRQQAALLST